MPMVILSAGLFLGLWWLEGVEAALRITALVLPLCFLGLWLCRGLEASERFRREMVLVFLASFVLHIWTSLVFFPLYMTTALDPKAYIQQGLQLSEALEIMPLAQWQELLNQVNPLPPNQATLTYMSGLFSISKSPLWISIFHSYLAALEGVLLVRIALRFYAGEEDEKTIRLAVWLLALFPLAHFWNGQVLKDPATGFLTVLFLDQVLAFFKDGRMRRLLVLGAVFWITAQIRLYFVPILLGASAVGLLLNQKAKGRGPLLAVFVVLLVMSFSMSGSKSITAVYQKRGLLELVWELRASQSPETLMTKASIGSILRDIPKGLIKLHWSPLPRFYEFRDDPVQWWINFCMLPWFALFPFFFSGAWLFLKEKWREGAVVWAYLFFYTLFFSVVAVGADPRHNLHVYPFWMLLAAIGLRRITFAHPLPWVMYFFFVLITLQVATPPGWATFTLKPLLAAAGLWFVWVFYNARMPSGQGVTPCPPKSPEVLPDPL